MLNGKDGKCSKLNLSKGKNNKRKSNKKYNAKNKHK